MNLLNPPPPRPLHPGLFLHQTPGGPDYSLADPRLQGWDREAQEEGKVLHPACVGRVGRGTRQVSPWACVPLGAGPISPAHPSIVPGGGTSSACPPLLLFCPNPGTWGLCSPTKAKQEGPPTPVPAPSLSSALRSQLAGHLQRLAVPWPLRPAHPLLAKPPGTPDLHSTPWGHRNKPPQTGWFKAMESVFSQSSEG